MDFWSNVKNIVVTSAIKRRYVEQRKVVTTIKVTLNNNNSKPRSNLGT